MKDVTFGKLVKTKRKELKITAEQLADKVGVDRTYISKIENKDIFPSLQLYAQIAGILKIKPADFPIGKYVKTKIPLPPEKFKTLLKWETKDTTTTLKKHIASELMGLSYPDEEKFVKKRILNFLEKNNLDLAKNKQLTKELTKIVKKMRRLRIDFSKRLDNEVTRATYLILNSARSSSAK